MFFPKMASATRQSSRETNQQPTKLTNRTNMSIQINNKKEQTITNFRKGVFTNDRE